jgi:hypothetical protein
LHIVPAALQIPKHVISRNTVKKRADGTARTVEASGFSNEREEYLLRHLLGDIVPPTHVKSEAIHATLPPPVQRSESLLIAGRGAAQQIFV